MQTKATQFLKNWASNFIIFFLKKKLFYFSLNREKKNKKQKTENKNKTLKIYNAEQN